MTTYLYTLSVGAMFKNEEHAIVEWIEHYLYHGVQHFYLINDGSTDTSVMKLQPYIDKGLVTLFNVDCKYYLGRQMDLYNTHILPQKTYADIIFRYKPHTQKIYTDITLEVSIANTLVKEYALTDKLSPFLHSIIQGETITTYDFVSNISGSALTQALRSYGYNLSVLQDGYNGLIQLIILFIIWRT
jgi:hypothetical protein